MSLVSRSLWLARSVKPMTRTNLSEAHDRITLWRHEPTTMVYDLFGVTPDPWQLDVLNLAGGDYKSQRRTGMKSCTGAGKTAVLAWLGWHRMLCFSDISEHPKGAALSKTRDNLRDNLWPELSKWQSRSDLLLKAFTHTGEKIYANDHPDTWFLSARSFAKDADAEAIGRTLSGLHSKFPFILLDETGDMPPAVGRAAEQIFTGSPLDAAIYATGNPTSLSGLLYRICNKLRSVWDIITITADPDDPNRTPRVDIELARQQIALEGRDNPWIMATILGLFPPADFNALLGIEDVEAAMARHYTPDQYNFAARILGVDVAREGNDKSVIFPRQGLVAFPPFPFRNVKSFELAGHIARISDDNECDGVIIDGTGGYGSGVLDAYEMTGRFAHDCQFSGEPYNKAKFYNKRAEIIWDMAAWIKSGGALPNVPELVEELTNIHYTFKGDKMIMEPKDQVKKNIGRSPDYSDALAVTFAEPIQKINLLDLMVEQMTPDNNQKEWQPFGDLP